GVGVVEAGGVAHPGRLGGRDRRQSQVGIAEQEHFGVMWILRPAEAEDLHCSDGLACSTHAVGCRRCTMPGLGAAGTPLAAAHREPDQADTDENGPPMHVTAVHGGLAAVALATSECNERAGVGHRYLLCHLKLEGG